MTEFAEWEAFYVIIGASAGALIGLQFIVMTLLAERSPKSAEDAIPSFSTPTIVHFSSVLLLSALISAPWSAIPPVAALLGVTGFMGLIYILITAHRMRKQLAYEAQPEDWVFHAAFPFFAYALLVLSAYISLHEIFYGLFGVGATALLLLFIGIHNTWDALTYIVFDGRFKGDQTNDN
jgi:hypothetical protein